MPLVFRFYDIRLNAISPSFAMSEGGAKLALYGKGIYDSSIKKLKFVSQADPNGVREIASEWDKKNRTLNFRLPPLRWLWGEEGENIEEEKLKEIMAKPISVYLTFNNQEWIQGPDFFYHNHVLERMRHAAEYMGEAPPEDRPAWEEEEKLEEPPEDMTEEQLAKYNEDKLKENEGHTEETKTVAKRKGYKVFLYGTDFKKTDTM